MVPKMPIISTLRNIYIYKMSLKKPMGYSESVEEGQTIQWLKEKD
jgi:hypothetical protein